MDYFYNWQEAVKYLYRQITAARPQAGYGIAVENTPYGTRVHLAGGAESAIGFAGYKGAFKLFADADSSGPLVTVNNGNADNEEFCGRVYCAGQTIEVPVFSDAPTGNCYVILTVSWAGNPLSPTYAAEISLVDSLPNENDDGVWSKIVVLGTGKLTVVDEDPVLTVVQSWTGGDLTVTDRWV